MHARYGLMASIVWVCVALLPRPAHAQAAPLIRFELSNWDLRRHVELVAAGADVVHAATEAALGKAFETVSTSRDRRGRLFRIGKLYVIDLPTIAVAHTLGHEYGHASRMREAGLISAGFVLDNWPWPVPFVNAHPKPGGSQIDYIFDPRALALSAGGYEAGRVRDRRFEDDFAASADVDHFSAARLIYSRLEEPLAALLYLRESQIRDEDEFFFGGSGGIVDARAYAVAFTGVRRGTLSLHDAQPAAREIRRHAAWALADLQLAGSFYRVANYLWTGEARGVVPAIAVRGNRFWPRATFALTPAGISRGAELLWVRDRRSLKVHAEKTEQAVPLDTIGLTDRGRPILADRTRSLWGGGLAVSAPLKSLRLRLEANSWNQETTGRGGSVEGRVEWPVAARAPRTSASVTVGYKTAGFLAGAPDAARWFGSLGLTIRP